MNQQILDTHPNVPCFWAFTFAFGGNEFRVPVSKLMPEFQKLQNHQHQFPWSIFASHQLKIYILLLVLNDFPLPKMIRFHPYYPSSHPVGSFPTWSITMRSFLAKDGGAMPSDMYLRSVLRWAVGWSCFQRRNGDLTGDLTNNSFGGDFTGFRADLW